MRAVLPALARPLIEHAVPPALDVTWFATREEAIAAIGDADIAWIDMPRSGLIREAMAHAGKLKWLSTIIAGIDFLDLARLKAMGTILTNGSGLNCYTVAEYGVLGVLAAAKRYDEVVRHADRREWPDVAPGTTELHGSSALILGYGTIGRLVGERLAAFGVAVTGVTRSGSGGTLRPDQWRARLGDFDWIVLAAPSTPESRAMIGPEELAAMKPSAWIVNIGRGELIDQPALIEALGKRRIGGAFLDVATPEPLPPDHPLWSAPNTLLTMHLSGRSQTTMIRRGAELFADNLAAFLEGRPMRNVVDLDAGY